MRDARVGLLAARATTPWKARFSLTSGTTSGSWSSASNRVQLWRSSSRALSGTTPAPPPPPRRVALGPRPGLVQVGDLGGLVGPDDRAALRSGLHDALGLEDQQGVPHRRAPLAD